MSNDLVNKLRDWETVYPEDEDKDDGCLYLEAADRIEELEDKLDWVITERDETFALMLDRAQTAEAKLAKAVEALGRIADDCETDYPPSHGAIKHDARTTLAELTGGKDE